VKQHHRLGSGQLKPEGIKYQPLQFAVDYDRQGQQPVCLICLFVFI
jgi:hypothetical protein